MDDPAFTRAVEGLKDVPELQFAPARKRAEIVRTVLEAVRDENPEVIDAILIQDPAIPVVGKLVAD
jgi:hypothetical protein